MWIQHRHHLTKSITTLRRFTQSAAALLHHQEPPELEPLTYLPGHPKPDPKHDETIVAIPRCISGKNISAKERKVGRVPSILFEQENGEEGGNKRLISVRTNQIKKLVNHLGYSFFLSRLFELEVRPEFESHEIIEKVRVLPRKLHLHAGTDAVLNVTFMRAPSSALLKVDVPLVFRGEDICPGLRKEISPALDVLKKAKAKMPPSYDLASPEVSLFEVAKLRAYLNTIKRTVKYLCPADIVPPYIDVDLSELDVGHKITREDLQVHPAIQLIQAKEEAVVNIKGARVTEVKKSK